MGPDAKENDSFLPKPSGTFTSRPSPDVKDSGGKKCCKCCTCKCCCCACVIVVIIIGALVLTGFFLMKNKLKGGASSENSGEWEDLLSGGSGRPISGPSALSGLYDLVSYEDTFESYLKAMGLPFFVIPLVMGSSERLNITVTDDGHWRIETKNDFGERVSEFHEGHEFSVVWGKDNGVMHSVCTMSDTTSLKCTAEERAKGWNFENLMRFSPGKGMISERYFVTKGVRTKKYYQLVNDDGSPASAELAAAGGMIRVGGDSQVGQAESPFSEDEPEDEDFWNSGSNDSDDVADDDFFGNDDW